MDLCGSRGSVWQKITKLIVLAVVGFVIFFKQLLKLSHN